MKNNNNCLQEIAPQTGVAFELKKDQVLTVIDPLGQQVADLFCVQFENTKIALSSGRSIDYNDTIRLTKGHCLYSFDGSPMLEIVADTCGIHDFLVTPCSFQMFKMLDAECDYHPSCQENLIKNMGKFGVDPSAITVTFNIFMNIPVKLDGSLSIMPPQSRPGDSVSLKAQMDLIVGLTACSDEGTNNGVCKPIHFRIESDTLANFEN